MIDMTQFVALSMAGSDKQVFDIVAHIGQRWAVNGLPSEMLAQLAEDPRVSDTGAADH